MKATARTHKRLPQKIRPNKKPFQIGDMVVFERDPLIRVVIGIGPDEKCATGWRVDAAAPECKNCGHREIGKRGYDAGWFTKVEPKKKKGRNNARLARLKPTPK